MESFSAPAQVEERLYGRSVTESSFALEQIEQIKELYDQMEEKRASLGRNIWTPEMLAYERVSVLFLTWDASAMRACQSTPPGWRCFVESHGISQLDTIHSGYQLSTPHEWPLFVENHEVPQLDTIHFGYHLLLDLLESLVQQYLRRISVLLSLLRGRIQGIKYKRPKHVICAAMPWTILPCLVVLWGVCWMFYNASQASSPVSGFENRSGQPARAADFDFDWGYDPFQGFNFDFLEQNVALFSNRFDPLEPMTSEAPIGVVAGLEVQEPRQSIPGLQQQQAAIPSSQSDQPLAPHDLAAVQEQTPSHQQARNPIPCTESGCHSEFGTERELRRHQETVHGRSEFPCTVTGCKRGDQNPFNRLDNLQRHMRKAHGQSEQTATAAPRNLTMRGQKRRAEASPEPVSSPESRRRRIEDAQGSVNSGLNPPPASCHEQDEVARLREQLAEARRQEEIYIARIKALEKEAEAQAVKFEDLRKDNEVQDAYIKYLGRKA